MSLAYYHPWGHKESDTTEGLVLKGLPWPPSQKANALHSPLEG